MNQSTRQTLIERISNNNDEKSWNEFVDIYQRYIQGFMINMGLDFHEAEDLTQKVLLKLWKKLPDFEYRPGECRFRSWLVIISRSLLRDYKNLKQNKMLDKFDLTDVPDTAIESELDLLSLKEWKDFISKMAWERISVRFKPEVLKVFLHSSGKDVATVSKETGFAENTVYVYKKRVETALKKEIYNLNYELG